MVYSIEQPWGRFISTIVFCLPATFLFGILPIVVFVSLEIRFVFGAIGAVASWYVSYALGRLLFRSISEIKRVRGSNPLPIRLESGVLYAYETGELDGLDLDRPVVINLSHAEVLENTGGFVKKLTVTEGTKRVSFFSSMKFVSGSYEELKTALVSAVS